jgi:predicted MFS family arabinose efflux permease
VTTALAPLAERQFRRLFVGELVSLVGSAAAPVALAFAVLDLTGSATDLGYVLAAGWVPQVLFILIGGVVGDRLPRQLVMVGANLLSGAAQGAAALLLLMHVAAPWQLALLQAARGTAIAFFFPASQSVVPQLVSPGAVQQANALLRLALNGSNVVGAAVGGVAVAAIGPGWAIAFDAATYLASAAILVRLHLHGTLERAESTIVRDLVEGWQEFRSRTWLWAVVAGASLGNVLWMGSFNVYGPLIAKRDLGGAAAFGAIVASEAAGLLAGGVVALRLRPARPLLVGVTALFPSVLVVAAYAGLRVTAVIAATAFVAGVGLELFSVYWITALHRYIPDRVLSRVNSYDALGSFVLIPVGLVVAGPIADAVGVTAALWGAAALGVLTIVAVLASRDVRELGAGDEPADVAAVGVHDEHARAAAEAPR